MPQPPNGAAQGAQAQSGAASNDAGANANANASEALSPDDIRAIVAEQVRAALDPKALSSAIAPVVNAAVTNHLKRTGSQQGQQAQQGEQAQQGQQQSAADSRALQELAALKEQLESERKARAESERRAVVDGAKRSMIEALAAKGITGAKARAIVADFQASGSFRLGEDGTPSLVVSRARTKGGKPAPLEYSDLADGIADWVQSDEAKEFLPAPSGSVQPPAGRGGARLRAGETLPKFDLTTEDGAVNAALHLLDNP